MRSAEKVKKKNPAIFLPLPMMRFPFIVLYKSIGISVLIKVKITYVNIFARRIGK